MHRHHLLFLAGLAGLAACDTDKNADLKPAGIPCEADFTLVLPDGSVALLDDCVHHGVEAEFVDDGSILPRPRALSFIFRSSADTDVDCWVQWDQEGVCIDEPWHDLADSTSTITWSTEDCGLISDAGRGTFQATSGTARLKNVGLNPGDSIEEGAMIGLEIEADIKATSDEGVVLNGTVIIDEEVPIVLTTETQCAGSDGDSDDDGSNDVVFGGTDCDDDAPEIGPHALEVCDGIDNNCDGSIDEDVKSIWYLDSDADGYGVEEFVEACDQPPGYAEFAGDCDDEDDKINPGKTEVCDGIDNDCDEVVDDGATLAVYPDEDDDGFGDDERREIMCWADRPDGWIDQGADCDDEDPEIHPDADEICDEIDNDCNGSVDDAPECEG